MATDFLLKGKGRNMYMTTSVVAVVIVAGILISYPGIFSEIVPGASSTVQEQETIKKAPVQEQEIVQKSPSEVAKELAILEEENAKKLAVVEEEKSEESTAVGGETSEKNVLPKSSVHTVEITSFGFNPDNLTIKKGDTVTFVAIESGRYWPASAIHPTHRLYPGSDIGKCGNGEVMFDSCGGLRKDEKFSFVFNEVGNWKYHDHLDPGEKGSITVTE